MVWHHAPANSRRFQPHRALRGIGRNRKPSRPASESSGQCQYQSSNPPNRDGRRNRHHTVVLFQMRAHVAQTLDSLDSLHGHSPMHRRHWITPTRILVSTGRPQVTQAVVRISLPLPAIPLLPSCGAVRQCFDSRHVRGFRESRQYPQGQYLGKSRICYGIEILSGYVDKVCRRVIPSLDWL